MVPTSPIRTPFPALERAVNPRAAQGEGLRLETARDGLRHCRGGRCRGDCQQSNNCTGVGALGAGRRPPAGVQEARVPGTGPWARDRTDTERAVASPASPGVLDAVLPSPRMFFWCGSRGQEGPPVRARKRSGDLGRLCHKACGACCLLLVRMVWGQRGPGTDCSPGAVESYGVSVKAVSPGGRMGSSLRVSCVGLDLGPRKL